MPTQRPIVALGADASTLVVGTATGVQIAHLDEPDNSLVSLPGVADEVTAMAADLSNHLAVADISGRISQWQLDSLEMRGPPIKAAARIASLDYSADGRTLIAGTGEMEPDVRMWDAFTGERLGQPLLAAPTGPDLEGLAGRPSDMVAPITGIDTAPRDQGAEPVLYAGAGQHVIGWAVHLQLALTVRRTAYEGTVFGVSLTAQGTRPTLNPAHPAASKPSGEGSVRADEMGRITFQTPVASDPIRTRLDSAVTNVAVSADGEPPLQLALPGRSPCGAAAIGRELTSPAHQAPSP